MSSSDIQDRRRTDIQDRRNVELLKKQSFPVCVLFHCVFAIRIFFCSLSFIQATLVKKLIDPYLAVVHEKVLASKFNANGGGGRRRRGEGEGRGGQKCD